MNTSIGYCIGQWIRSAQDNAVEGAQYLSTGMKVLAQQAVTEMRCFGADLKAGYHSADTIGIVKTTVVPNQPVPEGYEIRREFGLSLFVPKGAQS